MQKTIILFFLFLPFLLKSQETENTLGQRLDTASSVLMKNKVYFREIRSLLRNKKYEKSVEISKQLLSFSTFHQDSLFMTLACNFMVSGYYPQYEFDSTLKYAYQALDLVLANPMNSKIREAKIYNNIGLCYVQQEKHEEAIKWLLKSRTIREELDDPLISSTYSNLALEYYSLEDYNKASIFNKKGIELKKNQKKWKSLVKNYNLSGLIFEKEFKLDSAIFAIKEALKYSAEFKGNKIKHHPYYMNLA